LRLPGIVLLFILFGVVSRAFECSFASAIRSDRIGLRDGSPPGVWSLNEFCLKLIFHLHFCHDQFSILPDCFGFGCSVLFENFLKLIFLLLGSWLLLQLLSLLNRLFMHLLFCLWNLWCFAWGLELAWLLPIVLTYREFWSFWRLIFNRSRAVVLFRLLRRGSYELFHNLFSVLFDLTGRCTNFFLYWLRSPFRWLLYLLFVLALSTFKSLHNPFQLLFSNLAF
jgi:hypothetical protein